VYVRLGKGRGAIRYPAKEVKFYLKAHTVPPSPKAARSTAVTQQINNQLKLLLFLMLQQIPSK
jgi:hypothetical protein